MASPRPRTHSGKAIWADTFKVDTKIYKSFIKGKYDLFRLAYYMDGQFTKENFGSLDDAIARGKQVIRQLKGGEFDGTVMTSQDAKAPRLTSPD